MQKICYSATITVEFEPSWEPESDDDMWILAGEMSDNICLYAGQNEPLIRSMEISDYQECYIVED